MFNFPLEFPLSFEAECKIKDLVNAVGEVDGGNIQHHAFSNLIELIESDVRPFTESQEDMIALCYDILVLQLKSEGKICF